MNIVLVHVLSTVSYFEMTMHMQILHVVFSIQTHTEKAIDVNSNNFLCTERVSNNYV